jgi:hypothetical protein
MKASKRFWRSVNLFGGTGKVMKSFSRKGAKAQSFTPVSFFAPLRLCGKYFLVTTLILVCLSGAFAQTKSTKTGSHSTRGRASMSAEAKASLEEAIGIVCTQAKLDPKSSIAIDEMQARPSLPVHSPEAQAGAERAQRLLPLAKALVISSLRELTTEYGFQK